jgi:hypothetical protein
MRAPCLLAVKQMQDWHATWCVDTAACAQQRQVCRLESCKVFVPLSSCTRFEWLQGNSFYECCMLAVDCSLLDVAVLQGAGKPRAKPGKQTARKADGD